MPRPKPEDTSSAGQDSFLDVVTNIVGILIILVMVIGGRVQQIVLKAAPESAAKAESLLERAAQASPLQPEVWAKLARVRDRLGMHEKAEAARANEARILEALGRRAAPTAEKGAPAEGSPEKTPEKTPENSTEKPVDPPAAAKPVETPADAPKAPNAAGAPKEVAP